jgi:putative phosphoribosyl transferase
MKPVLLFENRLQAGRLLGEELVRLKFTKDVLVLGLARGGVPVALEVANALGAPLDVLIVRKLGVPIQPELAMGAIAADGTRVLDEEIIRYVGLSPEDVEAATRREQAEIERRERVYRPGRSPLDLRGRTVILVDDGLATGSTMLAAVRFARKRSPKKIVLAVPVGSVEALDKLGQEVDKCVCLAAPEVFYAISMWYRDFPQMTDAEVTKLLEEQWRQAAPAPTAG